MVRKQPPRGTGKSKKSPQSGTGKIRSERRSAPEIPNSGDKAKTGNGLITVTIKNHKDARGGHPHVILGDIDDRHVSVGLSTKPKKGKNAPNYKLSVDPLGTGKQAYARRQGTVAPRTDYEKPRTGKMTDEDHARITEYGNKAKQKYIEKKTKKSSDPPNTP